MAALNGSVLRGVERLQRGNDFTAGKNLHLEFAVCRFGKTLRENFAATGSKHRNARAADSEHSRTALGKLTHLKEVDVRTVGEVVRVTATVNGDIDAVVKAIAQHRVVDLAVEEPDLEESVLSLYGGQNA